MLQLPVEIDIAPSSDPPGIESDFRNVPVLVRVLTGRLADDLQRLETTGGNFDRFRRGHREFRVELALAARIFVDSLVRPSAPDVERPGEPGQRWSDARLDPPVARGSCPLQIHRVVVLAALGSNDVISDSTHLPDLDHLQDAGLGLGARFGLIRPYVPGAPLRGLVATDQRERRSHRKGGGGRCGGARRDQKRDEAAEPQGNRDYRGARRHNN